MKVSSAGCKIQYDDSTDGSLTAELPYGDEVKLGNSGSGVVRRMTAHGHMQACVSVPSFDRSSRLCSDNFEGRLDVSDAKVRCECKAGYRAVSRPDNNALMECVPEEVEQFELNSMPVSMAERQLTEVKEELATKKKLADDLAEEVRMMEDVAQKTEESVAIVRSADQARIVREYNQRSADHARDATLVAVIVSLVCIVCVAIFSVHVSKPCA